MGYELFFKATQRQPDRHDFEEYFESRAHYNIDDTQAWYENESTGVYFSFELSDWACDEFPDDASPTEFADEGDEYWVVFSLNYFRPHVFALEAALEVRAFIEHFHLSLDDPHEGGMKQGPFTDFGFVNGWNRGNALACKAMAEADPSRRFLTYPSAALECNWRWDFSVSERQENIAEDIFIPTIFYIQHRGEIKSVVCWPDAIPILIPHVDLLVIGRNAMATPPIAEEETGETALVEWNVLLPFLADFQQGLEPAPYYKLMYERAPEALTAFIRALPILSDDVAGIGKDEVLDAELIAAAQSGAN